MDELLISDSGPVRILTLRRPEARNALNGTLSRSLFRALTEADRDTSVRAVILTGTDPAFCAGVDLKEAARDGQAFFDRLHEQNPIDLVAAVATPIIGAVNGPAFTGGFELALSCDFLVASDRASFGDTHARVGVLPGSGLTVRLPALVGPAQARRISMTSEVIDAKRAERIGLVTEVVAHGELLPRCLHLAQAIAEAAPATMLPLKRMYSAVADSIHGSERVLANEIAAGHRSDFTDLEARRRAVQASNRAQLLAKETGAPAAPDDGHHRAGSAS
jgi:enoyl-CoA hydratase